MYKKLIYLLILAINQTCLTSDTPYSGLLGHAGTSETLLTTSTTGTAHTTSARTYYISKDVARIDGKHFLINSVAVGPTQFYDNIKDANYNLERNGKTYLIDGLRVSKKEYTAALIVKQSRQKSQLFWQIQAQQHTDQKAIIAAFNDAKKAHRKVVDAKISEESTGCIVS